MEVDSLKNHENMNADNSVLSNKDLEVQSELIKSNSIEISNSNNSAIDKTEIETSDQPIEENIVETSDQLVNKNITKSAAETSDQLIMGSIDLTPKEPLKKDIKTSDQLFEKIISVSNVKNSEQLIQKNILEIVAREPDQGIKENIRKTPDKSIKENIIEKFDQPLEETITISNVITSKQLIQKNILDFVTRTSDQQIKENVNKTPNEPIKKNNEVPAELEKNLVKISDHLLKEIGSISDIKTPEQPIQKNIHKFLTKTSDPLIKENIDKAPDELVSKSSIKTSDQPLKNIVTISDVKTSEKSIKNISEIVTRTSLQPIKNNTEASDKPLEKIISVPDIKTFDQCKSENVLESVSGTSNLPFKKSIDKTTNELVKKNIVQKSDQTENITIVSDVKTSEQLIKKNIVETSDKTLKETTIKPINQSIKKMSVSTVETTNEPIKKIIVEKSDQPVQENIVESSGQTFEKKSVQTCNQKIKKNNSVPPVNTLINGKLPIITKTEYLDLDKIAIPKMTNAKSNSTVLSSQVKKVKPISVVSTSSYVRIQPKLNITENKLSKPTQKLKIVSSNKSKPGFVLVPHNGMSYVVKKFNKEELKNESSLKSNSMTSATKPINSLGTSKVLKGYHIKKTPKFVTLVEKFPTRTFKMVPGKSSIPESLEMFLNKNIVPAVTLDSNQQKVSTFMFKSDKPLKYVNASGLRLIQQTNQKDHGSTPLANFHTVKKDIKLIPHTVTSKDLIENETKSVLEKSKINTNGNQEMSTFSSQKYVLPQTELLNQTDSKPLNIVKFGNFPNNGSNNFKLLPMNSLDKLKLNLITQAKDKRENKSENNSEAIAMSEKITEVVSNETFESEGNSSNKEFETTSNKNKLPFATGNIKKKRKVLLEGNSSKSNKLVACQNEHCDAMVFEPELIFNLYCSMDCSKNSGDKINFEPSPQKPKLDRKMVLQKLKNRIRERRKNTLLTLEPGQIAADVNLNIPKPLENDLGVLNEIENVSGNLISSETLKNSSNEQFINENETISDQKMQLPNIPQLADAAYLKSIEEGKQIQNYVRVKDFKSASKKLFDKPFPRESNDFKVDQRLEAIDPEHEALFCVMTVSEVCGYRLKLHFDGYSDDYDFWVNADSPDIFHIKWCEENDRPLQPPYDYGAPFDWSVYLRECRASPAPKSNFVSAVYNVFFKNHKFEIGSKLEALDKVTRTLPKQLICVATVADIMGSRIRVHFDGWTDDFDYWTSIYSTNLHPIGWCDNNGRILTPPCGYNDFRGKKPFSWEEYLNETSSLPVPEEAFERTPIRDFEIGTAIEVVDLVIPSLIRVAVIIDVKGNEIKILYDGFHANYAYWIEDDNPDVHPIGWCFKTHHPLEIPPEVSIWSCKVAGCNGKGNLNKKKSDHINPKDCPYEIDSWKKAVNGLLKKPDRLKPNEISTSYNTTKNSKSQRMDFQEKGKHKKQILSAIEPDVVAKHEDKTNSKNSNNELNTEVSNFTSNFIQDFTETYDETYDSLANQGIRWTRHKIFGDLPIFATNDPREWSVKEVAEYAELAVKNKSITDPYFVYDRFIEQEVDGECFLMLTKNDLLTSLHLPLGPAIKIYHAIKLLQERSVIFHNIVV